MDIRNNIISAEILDLSLHGRIVRNIDAWPHSVNSPSKSGCDMFFLNNVCIRPSTVPGSCKGVFSTALIQRGTRIGPYHGNLVTSQDRWSTVAMETCWEVLNKDGTTMGYINADGYYDNWLQYVQCARSDTEQNLEVVQAGSHIYYTAIQDICYGEELLVWYGGSLYMGLPYIVTGASSGASNNGGQWGLPYIVTAASNKGGQGQILASLSNNKVTSVQTKQQVCGSNPAPCFRWRCVLCKRGFNSHSNLRSHMRIHTLEKPFVCKFCNRKFSQSSTLRNHERLHTGEKPYWCASCRSSYSQLAGLRAHQRSSRHKPALSDMLDLK